MPFSEGLRERSGAAIHPDPSEIILFPYAWVSKIVVNTAGTDKVETIRESKFFGVASIALHTNSLHLALRATLLVLKAVGLGNLSIVGETSGLSTRLVVMRSLASDATAWYGS